MEGTSRVQLHLRLAFKHEVGDHPRVRKLLDGGYRIVDLQRLTDQEVIVTLARSGAPSAP